MPSELARPDQRTKVTGALLRGDGKIRAGNTARQRIRIIRDGEPHDGALAIFARYALARPTQFGPPLRSNGARAAPPPAAGQLDGVSRGG